LLVYLGYQDYRYRKIPRLVPVLMATFGPTTFLELAVESLPISRVVSLAINCFIIVASYILYRMSRLMGGGDVLTAIGVASATPWHPMAPDFPGFIAVSFLIAATLALASSLRIGVRVRDKRLRRMLGESFLPSLSLREVRVGDLLREARKEAVSLYPLWIDGVGEVDVFAGDPQEETRRFLKSHPDLRPEARAIVYVNRPFLTYLAIGYISTLAAIGFLKVLTGYP